MIYYWILFILLLFLTFIAKDSKKTENISLFSILFLVFLFFAFRIGFTPDYYGYEEWFRTERFWGVEDIQHEPLFSLMASTIPYRVALIIQTSLICLALFIALKKYIPVNLWSLAISIFFLYHYFILGNFSGFRSSFVTLAFFFGFVLRDEFKYGILWGATLIILSGLIHQAGFVMIVPYLICTRKRYSKKFFIIFSVLSAISIVFMFTMVQEMNSLVTQAVEENFTKFEAYMDDMPEERSIHITSIIYIFMFVYTALFLKTEMKAIEHIFVFQTCFFILLIIMPSIGMIDRFQFHFMFPSVIGCCVVVKKSTNNVYKTIYIISWGYLILRTLSSFVMSNNYFTRWAFYNNILF